ncbi:transporter [Roseovarius sp. EL26]|uniref:transporter n=1 Tax=Roseovarius sp. EL26 TaxID=2126672 RepID=UPI000EA275AC|nr:transporter [Roseovarius sp. EL26]
MNKTVIAALAFSASVFATSGHADGDHSQGSTAPINANGHAPIGVMGDHLHKQGEFMVSYRFMRMDMQGNRQGTNSISDDAIATGIPNRFAGMPGQPPTLRIVPQDMTMDMHMFGAMYAPSDRVTLMAMLPYLKKDMTLTTYQGGMGTNRLGNFSTSSEGIGDIKAGALVGLMDSKAHKVHLNLGMSLPTGSITERGNVLTPMGMTTNVRLPYSMQLGSGTYDLLPGVTYTGNSGMFNWGSQLRGTIRLGENDESYTLGDEAAVTAWASVQPQPWVSLSGRVEAKKLGRIEGMDTNIMGPVQTADPDNYGGETVNMFVGANFVAQRGALRGHRLALEAGYPIYQNLNGVQMETDWTLNAGWQLAF